MRQEVGWSGAMPGNARRAVDRRAGQQLVGVGRAAEDAQHRTQVSTVRGLVEGEPDPVVVDEPHIDPGVGGRGGELPGPPRHLDGQRVEEALVRELERPRPPASRPADR